jgi:peptidoglycan/xylan/chitin deacetylase (PgdA/CDA1 family)
LLYHHVGPLRAATFPSLTIDPRRFRAHLRWIARFGYRPVSSDDVVRWATRGAPLPPRSVLITFDDAYADLARWAFPVITELGFPATVFVVTDRIGSSNDWDAPHGMGGHRLLDEGEIRTWSGRGIDFGAHSRTHADLAELTDEELEHELVGSRSDLEALLARPVRCFAYPYGEPDERSRRAVEKVFDVAFTAYEGRNRGGMDPHSIKRTMVLSRDTALDFALRLRLGRSPKERMRSSLVAARAQILRRD